MARNIALKKPPGATIIKCHFNHDDGIPVYEIEIRKGVSKYNVKINAKTEAVLF